MSVVKTCNEFGASAAFAELEARVAVLEGVNMAPATVPAVAGVTPAAPEADKVPVDESAK